MARAKIGWMGSMAAVAALVVGACAGSSSNPVPPALISERAEVGVDTLSQPIMIMIVTPTPAPGQSPAGGDAQQPSGTSEAQQGSEGTSDGQESGGGGQAQASEQPAEMSDDELISMGEQVYAANCASCHGPEGQGGSSYPALAGNSVVAGEEIDGLVTTVLHGRGQMPAFADQLADEQIAAVLSYIRNAWGNEASTVPVSAVSQSGTGGQEQQAQQQDQQGEQQGQQQEQPQAEQQDQPQEQAGQSNGGEQGGQQVQVTTEQGTITIQLQIMVMTPEAAGSSQNDTQAEATPPPADNGDSGSEGQAEATPTPENGSAAAGGAEAESTPAPENNGAAGGESQAEAAPTPEREGNPGGAENAATPAPESSEDAGGSAPAAEPNVIIQIILTVDDAGNLQVASSGQAPAEQ